MGKASWREYLFPLAIGLFFVALGTLPYLYAYQTTPEDSTFMGFVGRGTPGANGYLMFAKQVRDGGHLMENQFSPKPLPRAYFNLEWYVFGKFSGLTGLSLIATFHVFRVLTVLGYVCAVYFLASCCIAHVGLRRLAVSLITLGSGLGWPLWIAGRVSGFDFPESIDLRGVCVPGHLVNKPHFIRAGLFAALKYGLLLRGEQTGKRRYFVASGLAALAHASLHPYPLPTNYLVYAGFPAVLCLRDGHFSLARFKNYALAGLILFPAVLYYAWMAHTNVLGMEGWTRQSLFLVETLVWLGIPAVAVVVYFLGTGFTVERIRTARPETLLIVLWLVMAWFVVNLYPYFPAGHESAIYPYMIAPALLLVLGPVPAWRRWARARGWPWARGTLAACLLVLACMPSSVYVYTRFFRDLHHTPRHMPWRFYLPNSLLDAMAWLDKNTPKGSVVLASPETAQFIPRLTHNKVVAGHDMISPNHHQKAADIWRFYHAPGDAGFKDWFAAKNRVKYVLLGPFEDPGTGLAPEELDWLKPAYESRGVRVFRVVWPG